jgi:hypothetical protein
VETQGKTLEELDEIYNAVRIICMLATLRRLTLISFRDPALPAVLFQEEADDRCQGRRSAGGTSRRVIKGGKAPVQVCGALNVDVVQIVCMYDGLGIMMHVFFP